MPTDAIERLCPLAATRAVAHHACMDGSACRKNEHRTLASQPAAAAHVGATVTAAAEALAMRDGERGAIGGAVRRTRLERMLLAARQMQQH